MGWFSKDKLTLEDLANDLMRLILKRGPQDESFKEMGIDLDKPEHQLEMIVLRLFALKVAAPFALQDRTKADGLTLLVETLVKTGWVEIMKLGTTDQFERILNERYSQYSRDFKRIGRQFSESVTGKYDIVVEHMAMQLFLSYQDTNKKFLAGLNEKFNLI